MSARLKKHGMGCIALALAVAAIIAGSMSLSVRAQTQPPTTQPGSRQPSIVTNQFNTTSGASLIERRPGLMIQQAIALNQGTDTEFLTGDIPLNNRFLEDTFYMMFEALIEGISNFLQTLNLAGSLGGLNFPSLDSLGGANAMTPATISNSTTTGTGSTTTIP